MHNLKGKEGWRGREERGGRRGGGRGGEGRGWEWREGEGKGEERKRGEGRRGEGRGGEVRRGGEEGSGGEGRGGEEPTTAHVVGQTTCDKSVLVTYLGGAHSWWPMSISEPEKVRFLQRTLTINTPGERERER